MSVPVTTSGLAPVPPQGEPGSFFSALFDTRFTTFIVPHLIRYLYMFFMVVGALVALAAIVTAFNSNAMLGFLALVLSPVLFLLVLIQARVTLELITIVFRIEHNTAHATYPRPVA